MDSSPSDNVLSTGPDRDWSLDSASSSAMVADVVDSGGFFLLFPRDSFMYLYVSFSLSIRYFPSP